MLRSLCPCFPGRWWTLALCGLSLFMTPVLAQQGESRIFNPVPQEVVPRELVPRENNRLEPRLLERRLAREGVLPSGQLSSRLTLSDIRLLDEDRLRNLPPAVRPPVDKRIQRRILEDGTLESRYPDGLIHRLRPDGNVESVSPDGMESMGLRIHVEDADLPLLPEELSGWGSMLGEQLLILLRNILSEAEFAAYRQTEVNKDYYELIEWRLRSLNFLTASQ